MVEEPKEINKEIQFRTPADKIAGMLVDSIAQCNFYLSRGRCLLTPEEEVSLSRNQKVSIQVGMLPKIIAAEQELIRNASAPIHTKVMDKKEPNDYTILMEYKDILKDMQRDIVKARRTRRLDDDFMIWTNPHESNAERVNDLTENFDEMIEDQEDLFVLIQSMLLKNGLLAPVAQDAPRRGKLNEL